MAHIGTQSNTKNGPRRARWGWALLGFISLCALAWGFHPDFVFNRSLYRDRQRIRDFAGSHAGIEPGSGASGRLQVRVDCADMDGARKEYSGWFDRNWRTPDALSREFVFRIGRPGDLELMVAAARAESVRDDANAAIRLASILESAEAAEAVADALWSDPAIRVLLGDSTMSNAALNAAIAWGGPACNVIATQENAATVNWMNSAAHECCMNELRNSCSGVSSLRALVASVDLDSRVGAGMSGRTTDERLAVARVSAQAAAITLSSIAEARLAGIGEVQDACAGITTVRITEFLDSLAGLWDTPKAVFQFLTKGYKEVVQARLQSYILDPALVDQLPDRIREVRANALYAIRNRIRDECDGDVQVIRESEPSREGAAPEASTVIGGLPVITAVDLLVGTTGVLDAGMMAAVALGLTPEPTGLTKLAAVLVAAGDITWQLTQVTPALRRRAEQAAILHNAVSRAWIGTAGRTTNLTLPEGTVIDRAHASSDGALFEGEQRAFAHLRREIRGRIGP